MELRKFFAAGRIAALIGLLLFALIAVAQLQRVAKTDALGERIIALQSETDAISARADHIALNGIGADQLRGFFAQIDTTRDEIFEITEAEPEAAAVDKLLAGIKQDIETLTDDTGAVSVPTVLNQAYREKISMIAAKGEALDQSILGILVKQKQIIASRVTRSVLELAATSGFLLIGLLLYLFRLQAHTLTPITSITRAVDRIHDGDLTVRLDPRGDDEMSRLARQVDEMAIARAEAESELRMALEDLTSLNARMLRTQEIGRLGAWHADPKAGTLTWDQRTYEIFELDPSEFANTPEDFFSRIHPDDRARFDELAEDQLKSGKPYDIPHRIVTGKGNVKWVWERAEVIRDADGDVIALDGTVQDITEMKQVELALEQSREAAERTDALLKIAGRTARFGGWRFVIGSDRVDWTDQTAEIHDQPTGTNPTFEQAMSHFSGCDRQRLERCVKALLENGTEYDGVFRATTAKGRDIWMRLTGEPVHDAQGQITEIHGACQDITDLIHARGEAERRNAELEGVVSALDEGFLALDESGCVSFVNNQARELLDMMSEPLAARDIAKLLADAPPKSPKAVLANALASPGPLPPAQAHDIANDRWVEIHVHDIRRRRAVFVRDVTTSRKDHERLLLLEAAMEEIDDIVLITESDNIDGPDHPAVVYANAAFERITGFARSDIIGRTPRILQGPETQRAELDRVRAALQDRRPVSTELLNYTAGGDPIWLQIEIFPIFSANGERNHFVAIETDVTAQKARDEHEFERAKLESIGQLTGSVAHDFNNLLTVILGNTELLRDNLKDEQVVPPLNAMIQAAERGARLTDSLLAFARRTPLQPVPTDVNALLKASLTLLRQAVRENIDITLSLPDNPLVADVDPSRLQASLVNLVLNSRDAIRDHGQIVISSAAVTLKGVDNIEGSSDALPDGDYICVSVTDTGQGMTPVVLSQVFEPFFTTKPVGAGTGLGLSTVYGFARQSRGTVRLRSDPGEGTKVDMLLPATEAKPQPADGAATNGLRSGQGEHILIVEDDSALQDFVATRLRSLGYHISIANDAAAALDCMQRENGSIDLLFSDIVLPGKTSGQALARLARQRWPHLRVLLTSGYAPDLFAETDSRSDGQFPLLRKPYRATDLAEKIRDVLDADV